MIEGKDLLKMDQICLQEDMARMAIHTIRLESALCTEEKSGLQKQQLMDSNPGIKIIQT